MTGAGGVAPGKAGRACRLTMLSRRRRAGETETAGRGLQLDEAGAGCGFNALVPGNCAVNAYRKTGLKNGLYGLEMQGGCLRGVTSAILE